MPASDIFASVSLGLYSTGPVYRKREMAASTILSIWISSLVHPYSQPKCAHPMRITSDADVAFARKRADYFAAGTKVVWDVDPWNGTVESYSATNPAEPFVYRRGMIADTETALPGWQIAIDDISEPD
jgi:hypothetical protein